MGVHLEYCANKSGAGIGETDWILLDLLEVLTGWCEIVIVGTTVFGLHRVGPQDYNMELTKEALRKICQKDGLYSTPALNDKLYLHYKVAVQNESRVVLEKCVCVCSLMGIICYVEIS